MKNLNRIDRTVNIIGLIFGIFFFVAIFIGTVVPLGIALDTKAYIQSAIAIIYPIGLFIGIKFKRLGIVVCLASMVASISVYFYDRTVVNLYLLNCSFSNSNDTCNSLYPLMSL